MHLLSLPNELLLTIADKLDLQRDINVFARANYTLYRLLNTYLYARNVNQEDSSALLWAAKHGQQQTIQKLLNEGANIRKKSGKGETLLGIAIKYEKESLAEFLLNHKGGDYDLDNNRGGFRTPLMWAAQHGFLSLVKKILERGLSNGRVSLHTADYNGRTALSVAVSKGHTAIVELLISKGADPNVKDYMNASPLIVAAYNGYVAIVNCLLAHHVEMNISDENGRTALSYAAGNGYEAVVKSILAHNDVNPNMLDRLGRSPLSYAAEQGHEAVVRMLLAKEGIQPALLDKNARSPLWHAIKRGRETVAKLLLVHDGTRINTQDRWIVMEAITCGNLELARCLLDQKDIDKNLPNIRGD